MNDITMVDCPTCGKLVIWDELSSWRPFCSKRCQLIDLGEWAAEEKKIPSRVGLNDNENWSEQPLERD